ncbi:uncharacterized protein UDID_01409 [Ustilago sp. UG-2017a]|nr:uncharacterized protein UDID_01409 [Ustilago sp. UG-2017a]
MPMSTAGCDGGGRSNGRELSTLQAAQEEDDYDERDAHRYEAADDYYSTPFSSPLKRPVDMSQRYAQVDIGDNSFEACCRAGGKGPSGRMYDTPNANYYPTRVMVQSEGYYAPPQRPIASPFAAVPDQHTTYAPMPRGAGYSNGGYILSPPPRCHY